MRAEEEIRAKARHLIVACLVVLAGCSGGTTSATTPTATPSPTTDSYSLTDNTVTYQVQRATHPPTNWTFPVTVTFQRYENETWSNATVVTVNESETFQPELDTETRYRVFVKDADGDRRMLGGHRPAGKTDVVFHIGPCCNDTF